MVAVFVGDKHSERLLGSIPRSVSAADSRFALTPASTRIPPSEFPIKVLFPLLPLKSWQTLAITKLL